MATGTRMRIYAFGDQTYNVADTLSEVLRGQDPVVLDFLERSTNAIRREVARLAPEQQAQCPRFGSLASLLAPYRSGTLNPALCQALTCTAQLAVFLRCGTSHATFHHTRLCR
jgi:hypothetical protein